MTVFESECQRHVQSQGVGEHVETPTFGIQRVVLHSGRRKSAEDEVYTIDSYGSYGFVRSFGKVIGKRKGDTIDCEEDSRQQTRKGASRQAI